MLSFIIGFTTCYLMGALAIGSGTVRNSKLNGMPIQRDEYFQLLKFSFGWPLLMFVR